MRLRALPFLMCVLACAFSCIPLDVSAQTYQQVTSWGGSGGADGTFSAPFGLAIDTSRDYLYVSDIRDARIQRFSLSGTFQTKWGSLGTENGRFLFPSGVAVDGAGNVFVKDMRGVQIFDTAGQYKAQWQSSNHSCPIAVDKDGFFYIADDSNRIKKMSVSGTTVLQFGSTGSGDGQFVSPRGLAVDKHGNIFVVDHGVWGENSRVQKFDSTGTFKAKWSLGINQWDGTTRLCGIAFDRGENVFVHDDGSKKIFKFSLAGSLLDSWDITTRRGAIGVDRNGNVYLTGGDDGDTKVHVFNVLLSAAKSVDFGSVAFADSAGRVIWLKNSTSSQLRLNGLSVRSRQFGSAQALPESLAPGDSVALALWFRPLLYGLHTDSILVQADAGVFLASVQGFCPRPTLISEKSLLDFRSVAKHSTASMSIFFRNTSISDLIIDSIFTRTKWFSTSFVKGKLLGTDSLIVAVLFTPDSFATYSDSLIVVNNSATSTFGILLKGDSPPPVLSIVAHSVLFSPTAVGDSTVANITLCNKSVNRLVLSSYRIISPVFSLAAGPPQLVEGNDSLTIQLRFKPISFGNMYDTLSISSDGGTAKIALLGNSPYPILARDRPAVDFGEVAKGTVRSQTLVIRNLSINTLVIDSATTRTRWFGALLQKHSITSTDSLALPLYFTPDSLGTYADTLLLYNNSATRIVKVPLTGNSPNPVLTASSLTLNLPQTAVGDSVTRGIWLYNKTPNVVTVSGISNVTQFFSTSRSTPLQINGFDSTDVKVTFRPKAFGDISDLFTVTSDGGTVKVLVNGLSPHPCAVIRQQHLDFWTLSKDSTRGRTLTVTDTSINPLRIDSLYTKTRYFKVPFQQNPATVKKGDSLTYVVTFTPDSAGIFTDTLYVLSNSVSGVSKIGLRGEGTLVITYVLDGQIPNKFQLYQNYPNPFNPSTSITFDIPQRTDVSLRVIDLLGRVVAVLVEGIEEPGHYNLPWNANVPSGIYFYRLQAGDFRETKKMILLR